MHRKELQNLAVDQSISLRCYFSGCFLKQAQPRVFIIAHVATDSTLLSSEFRQIALL